MPNSPESSYSFSLTIGSEEIPVNVQSFKISLSDSIYSLCPVLKLTANDFSGLMMEQRLNILGQDIAFTISDAANTSMLPMTCVLYEVPQAESSNGLSGTFEMQFKHTMKFSSGEAKGWSNTSPANVFSNLVTSMNQRFNSFSRDYRRNALLRTNISNKCVSYPLILNPALDNEEFVDQILLPLSSDGSLSASPFMAFIDAMNCGHYEDLKTMYDRAPSRTLVLGKPADHTIDSVSILALQSFSQDYNKISGLVDESFVFLDQNDEVKSQDTFLSKTFNPIALMRNISRTSIHSPESYDYPINRDEEIGKLNHQRRKGLMIDKLIVSVFMDLNLCAGKTVQIDTYLNTNGDDKAESYSGKFLIEASEHLWDPSGLLGYTHLVLGRPTLQVKGKETG